MEIRWNGRRKKSLSRLLCPVLTLMLAAGLIAAAPGLTRAAEAVDVGRSDCSLTIHPGGGELSEDLAKANVVVDLYKVADAVETEGKDGFTFAFLSGYESLKGAYDQNPDNESWRQMAQTAAKYALESGEPISKGNPVDKKVENLACGLYLLIARGADIEDYKTTVKNEDGTEEIATIARSESHDYTFAPELIALPSRQNIDENGNEISQWVYDMEVTLKPEQKGRPGSLEIVKNLATYNVNVPAVFVFQVEAELEGEVVYSDVVTLTFTEAGQKTALLENKIPVGAKVTVTEIYSGASYKITSADEQKVTIEADKIASVEFSNDHDTTNHGGGGVNNHFTYDAENGWQLEKQPANRADGE